MLDAEVFQNAWKQLTAHEMRILNRQVNYGETLGVMYRSAFIEWAVENGWQFSRRNKALHHEYWTAWNPAEDFRKGIGINPAGFRFAMLLGGVER